jgi:2-amino-4-hydroxy-6-hydroxymethyldihydropteridine diphosphokinase
MKPALVYLAIGSNIAPATHIPMALDNLKDKVSLVEISTIWETPPVGTSGPNFYNLACGIRSPLSQDDLRQQVLRVIEADLGRIRGRDKFAPRPIDLDIVIYSNEVIEPNIWRYAFYAVPLAELLPDLVDPASHKRLIDLAQAFFRRGDLIPHPELLIKTP